MTCPRSQKPVSLCPKCMFPAPSTVTLGKEGDTHFTASHTAVSMNFPSAPHFTENYVFPVLPCVYPSLQLYIKASPKMAVEVVVFLTPCLTRGQEARNNGSCATGIHDSLCFPIRRSSTHVVVHRGQDGSRLLGDVNTSEDLCCLRNTWLALGQSLRRQMTTFMKWSTPSSTPPSEGPAGITEIISATHFLHLEAPRESTKVHMAAEDGGSHQAGGDAIDADDVTDNITAATRPLRAVSSTTVKVWSKLVTPVSQSQALQQELFCKCLRSA